MMIRACSPASASASCWRVLVDPHHDAVGVLELVDRVLQLAVEHHPVGDHHDLVEHLRRRPRRAATRAGAPARRSCSTCPTRPSAGRGSRARRRRSRASAVERAHGVPLVDTAGRSPLGRRLRALRRLLDVDEPVQQVEPGVALPDLLPQVRGAVPVRVRRVARAQLVAPVERQEPGRLARRAGSSSPPARCRPRSGRAPAAAASVRRVAVGAVLRHRVLDVWPVSGFFSSAVATGIPLTNRHRSSVFVEPASYGSWRVTVSRFASYRSHQLRRQPVRGLEVRQPERRRRGRRPRGAAHRPCRARRSAAASRSHEPRCAASGVAAVARRPARSTPRPASRR